MDRIFTTKGLAPSSKLGAWQMYVLTFLTTMELRADNDRVYGIRGGVESFDNEKE